MEITILGTSAMVPTKQRNVSGIFVRKGKEGILFDCGEGTQRQMNITGINRNKVTKIFISHWHGDHVAGIIGLLQTIGNIDQPPRIDLYGPKETKERMDHLMKSAIFDVKINLHIHEIDAPEVKKIVDTKSIKVLCANMKHGAPCLGYALIEKDRRRINTLYLKKHNIPDGPHLAFLQEGKEVTFKGKKLTPEEATKIVKGKKFTYCTDTEPCKNVVELAKNADLLVMEATYSSKLEHKAREYNHTTAKEAALVANDANVKKLVLTHFSQRYENTQEIEEDARIVFDNVMCAEDFMKIRL